MAPRKTKEKSIGKAPISKDIATSPLFAAVRADRDVNLRIPLKNNHSVFVQGPSLSLFDEDTLLAAMTMAIAKATTSGENSKYSVDGANLANFNEYHQESLDRYLESLSNEDDLREASFSREVLERSFELVVHPASLNEWLHIVRGGKVESNRYDSILRLASVKIAVCAPGEKPLSGKPLIEVTEITRQNLSLPLLKIRIGDEVRNLLEDYIKIDMDLRSSLSPAGKILQRHLIAHGFPEKSHITITLKELVSHVRPDKSLTEARPDRILRKAKDDLATMMDSGFINDFQVEGRRGHQVIQIYGNSRIPTQRKLL